MKNAHERFGWLEFEKQLKDTRTRLRVALDRFISEPAENKEASGTCHLVSVFGNDVDIGAIWAGLAGQEWVTVSGPDLAQRRVTLGKHHSRGWTQPQRASPGRPFRSGSR